VASDVAIRAGEDTKRVKDEGGRMKEGRQRKEIYHVSFYHLSFGNEDVAYRLKLLAAHSHNCVLFLTAIEKGIASGDKEEQ
jgi:hypothetical protein